MKPFWRGKNLSWSMAFWNLGQPIFLKSLLRKENWSSECIELSGGRAISFCESLLPLIFIVPATLAQQPQPPPPAPAPAESQADKPKDAKEEQDKKTIDDQIGKSKLEKETGTINDRIFEVMPNYGTVETSQILPPLTTGQKFRLATAGVFDWTAYPFNGVLAAVAQAKNDPASWGQGWGAYGKRYGESFADNSIGTYMTTAIFPSLLHEDPRYYQLGRGSFAHRAYHAVNRLVRHPHRFGARSI